MKRQGPTGDFKLLMSHMLNCCQCSQYMTKPLIEVQDKLCWQAKKLIKEMKLL